MDIFAISPASPKPLWLLAIICLLLLAVLAALAYTAYASRNSRVEVDVDRIRLVGDFWGREVPFTQLDVSAARVVDLEKGSEYALKRRTFGTGLPGYASGWFRLRGGEKVLVYLTRHSQIVYLPTTNGYSLLLSIDEPERFIELLRQKLEHW